ncbi:flagellar export protein FliJ [Sporolactobacillus shoreicorticis]|uniref:Flagellar FliJ protein n=1 Tax=Sporolactobacillus shoreicorticis TaxID=1923877 RepID=A0ABW5S9B7_9BACL|nr:flagellar export protein FliJ [Sporolactobacillus shoreicorticis]MCO7125996.1 flagellar export protein FliJ [Sporolactobacillus shoreicorticis]
MGFEYRFERVMKLAENEKYNLEVQYKRLFDEFESLARKLIELMDLKEKAQTELQNQMSQAITIDQMKMGITDVNTMDSLIDETNKRYIRAKARVEDFQTKLQEKAMEVKKYEKIKEKQQSIYRRLTQKAEIKRMDEIAGQRTAR